MKTFRYYILTSLLIAGLAYAAAVPQKGGEDETGPYEVVPNWPVEPQVQPSSTFARPIISR
jgi:hypothetical protein